MPERKESGYETLRDWKSTNVAQDYSWNIETAPYESVYEANRDVIGPEHNFNRVQKAQDSWNWLLRYRYDEYNGKYMKVGALFFGAIHGWLWQQTLFQWTPTMNTLRRSYIINILYPIPIYMIYYF